jgi:glycosyltransferase involved in cell wall biosynthesis
MAKSPLVSVTMPVYNGERTIHLAINSLLHQTYNNWKCIVVNDCSTDGTADILKKYEADPRFKIIHLQKNKGRGNARQIALENAEGDYLAFLDADDFYHPEKLEFQVKVFREYSNIVLCSTGVGSFDNNFNLRAYRGINKNGNLFKNFSSKIYPSPPASTMIRMDIAKNNFYNTQLDVAEDNDFIYKCLLEKDYYIINKILYYYEEIGVVSYSKFISYQFKYLNTLIITSKGNLLLFSLSKEIPKFIVKCIGGFLFGVDFFLIKRGKKPSDLDKREMKHVLIKLNQA